MSNKTSLTKHHRGLLTELAANRLTQIIRHELNADAADRAMMKLVQSRIREEYPPKDMAVLRKYKATGSVSKLKVSLDGSSTYLREFALPEEQTVPQSDVWGLTISVTGEVAKRWFDVQTAITDQFDKRISDYRRLILGARYFEDVVEAFPAAAELTERIAAPCTALVIVDDEALHRIRRDSTLLSKLTPVGGAAK